MQDAVTPAVVQAVVDAHTAQDAHTAIQMVQAAQDEDDLRGSLNRLFAGKPFYASKKFWMSILTTVLPIALQAATGAVSWPVAAGIAGAAGITYVLSQMGVDRAQATAAGDAVSKIAVAKLAKK